uniref:Uncharacterized protein n=1 Tax=Heliothis virescens TaxID=7102 RepID=A0A2A4JUT4_HELVI
MCTCARRCVSLDIILAVRRCGGACRTSVVLAGGGRRAARRRPPSHAGRQQARAATSGHENEVERRRNSHQPERDTDSPKAGSTKKQDSKPKRRARTARARAAAGWAASSPAVGRPPTDDPPRRQEPPLTRTPPSALTQRVPRFVSDIRKSYVDVFTGRRGARAPPAPGRPAGRGAAPLAPTLLRAGPTRGAGGDTAGGYRSDDSLPTPSNSESLPSPIQDPRTRRGGVYDVHGGQQQEAYEQSGIYAREPLVTKSFRDVINIML